MKGKIKRWRGKLKRWKWDEGWDEEVKSEMKRWKQIDDDKWDGR